MELFNDQNFERIRKKHAELGVPWSDPTFGATNSSIGLSKVKDLPRNIEWKRPYVRFNFNSSWRHLEYFVYDNILEHHENVFWHLIFSLASRKSQRNLSFLLTELALEMLHKVTNTLIFLKAYYSRNNLLLFHLIFKTHSNRATW